MATYQAKHADAFQLSDASKLPELVHRTSVDWSSVASKNLRVGMYLFQFIVNERGEVVDPVFIRGPEGGGETYLLDQLRGWQYAPAMKDGKPVSVVLTVTWQFCA